MSGEYYCIEEVVDPLNYYDDYESKRTSSKEPRSGRSNRDMETRSNTSKKSQDFRLHEIEEQLEIAENRCNTLKGQLDTMKKIYHKTDTVSSRTETILTQKVEKQARKRQNEGEAPKSRPCSPIRKRFTSDFYESTDTIPPKSSSSSTAIITNSMPTPLIRQNSSCIGTDHTGSAVRTINNILTGITDSVNRLSQMHVQDRTMSKRKLNTAPCEVSLFPVIETPCSPRVEKRLLEQQQKVEEMVTKCLEENTTWKKKNKHSHGSWSRHTSLNTPIVKAKFQCSSGSVNLVNNIGKFSVKNEAKVIRKSEEPSSGLSARKRKRSLKKFRSATKQSISRKFIESEVQIQQQVTSSNLVELYHNAAANDSESDDSNKASKCQVSRQKGGGDLSIPIPVFDVQTEDLKPINNKVQTRPLTPINENGYVEPEAIQKNEFYSSNITKNYELPTISSRMKQVTKSYLQSFNFRSIPFCAAKSISPSHNIGINIQQVMSIIKTRQPITGISPTLAHNISLAAGKLQSRPLSALVSTLSSKIGYGRSQCPLIKSSLNYSQLQEMAREIPEDPDEEQEKIEVDNQIESNINNVFVNGSGDREERKNLAKAAVWSVDPDGQQRCTCASLKGVPFQQVLSKFQITNDGITELKPHTAKLNVSRPRASKLPIYSTARKQRIKTWVKNEPLRVSSKHQQPSTLQGKEKNLKTVLKNLHDEFETLNNKYEDLAKQVTNDMGTNESTAKQLEEMEKALNKKEEEINMVMSLYTEVLALKDQVKKLRDRTSLSSVLINLTPSKTQYKEPKAALHLTQLLRQIQNYQTHCKSKV